MAEDPIYAKLKNASAADLRILQSALTPHKNGTQALRISGDVYAQYGYFVGADGKPWQGIRPGGNRKSTTQQGYQNILNPPGVPTYIPGPTTYKDTRVIDILEKYKILTPLEAATIRGDPGTRWLGPEIINPILGVINNKDWNVKTLSGQTTKGKVVYAKPTQKMVDKAKKESESVVGKPGLSAPYDGIVVASVQANAREDIQRIKEEVDQGWADKSTVLRITKDEDGDPFYQLYKYSPEATQKWRSFAQYLGRDPYEVPKQLVPVNPWTGLAPANRSTEMAIALGETPDGTPGTIVGGDDISPLSLVAGNLTALTEEIPTDSNLSLTDKQIGVMGINAFTIKLTNSIGNFGDYTNFMAKPADGTTWGGKLHIVKDGLIGVRSFVYNINALQGISEGLYHTFVTGDVEAADEGFAQAGEYIYKEYMWVTRVNWESDFFARVLVAPHLIDPNRPTWQADMSDLNDPNRQHFVGRDIYRRAYNGRGANSLRKWEIDYLKKNNPKLLNDLYGNRIGGALSTAAADNARTWISNERASRRVNRLGGGIGTGIYGLEYVFMPMWDKEVAEIESQLEKLEGSYNVASGQKEIALMTNNQVIIDDNDFSVLNPETGKVVNLQLPSALFMNSDAEADDDVVPNSIKGGGYSPSTSEQFKRFIVHGTHDTHEFIDNLTSKNMDAFLGLKALGETNTYLKGLPGVTPVLNRMGLSKWGTTPWWDLGKIYAIDPKTNLIKLDANGNRILSGAGKFGKVLTSTSTSVVTMFVDPSIYGKYGEIGLTSDWPGYLRDQIERRRKVLREGKVPLNPQAGYKWWEFGNDQTYRPLTQQDVDNLNSEIEVFGRQLEGWILNTQLPSTKDDPSLNSNTQLFLEAEAAKDKHTKYKNHIHNLERVAKMYEKGTSPTPNVPINNVNDSVNFIINPDTLLPPWKQDVPDTRIPFTNPPVTGDASCFPEYTMIKTKYGDKKISEFSIGDSVLSFDVNGTIEDDFVSEVFIHEETEIYRYYFTNGHFLDITKEHPVLVQDNIFKKIGDLKIGDFVIDINQNKIEIQKIELLTVGTVYNIEVYKNHTYIADNIRVHNKPAPEYSGPKLESGVRAFLIYSENMDRDYKDWLNQNFPNVLQQGFPYIPDETERVKIKPIPPPPPKWEFIDPDTTPDDPENEPAPPEPYNGPMQGEIAENYPYGDSGYAGGNRPGAIPVPQELLPNPLTG